MKADGSNAPVVKKPQALIEAVQSPQMQAQIGKALPKHIRTESFVRNAVTILRNNPKLQQCDFTSFLGALMESAQLGLEPNTTLGYAYIIPYGNKAQFQLGYKGIVDLCNRTGLFRNIDAYPVYPNDDFSYQYGLHPDVNHVPADKPEGEPIYYYASYRLTNGGERFRVWSAEKCREHGKKYSKAFGKSDSPWQTNFPSMAMKTVLIDLLKLAPKSRELERAVSVDNAHIQFDEQHPDDGLRVEWEPVEEDANTKEAAPEPQQGEL